MQELGSCRHRLPWREPEIFRALSECGAIRGSNVTIMSAARARRGTGEPVSALLSARRRSITQSLFAPRDPDAFGPTFFSARWGLIPGWIKAQRPGKPPPVNARCEGTNGMFQKAYASRRCLIPTDGFFDWKDIFGHGQEQAAYASAMKSGEPFALAASGRAGEIRQPARTSASSASSPARRTR